MTPQIDNQIDNTTTTVTLPSKTYKLNVNEEAPAGAANVPIYEYIDNQGVTSIAPANYFFDVGWGTGRGIVTEIDFALRETTGTWTMLDYNASSSGYGGPTRYVLYNYQGKCIIQTPGSGMRPPRTATYDVATPDTKRHKIVWDNGSYYFDGNLVSSSIPSAPFSIIFGHITFNPRFPSTSCKFRLYSLKQYNKTTRKVVHEYVGAYDSSTGHTTLYDKVENKFFYYGNIPFSSVVGPLKEYYRDYKKYPEKISGYVDNLEAMKQAIYHILMTERYAYIIYSDNYGVEFEQYIGAEFDYLQSTIQSTLKDALMYDLRIKDVKVDEVTKVSTDIANVKFTAYTIYGDLQLEVNINV